MIRRSLTRTLRGGSQSRQKESSSTSGKGSPIIRSRFPIIGRRSSIARSSSPVIGRVSSVAKRHSPAIKKLSVVRVDGRSSPESCSPSASPVFVRKSALYKGQVEPAVISKDKSHSSDESASPVLITRKLFSKETALRSTQRCQLSSISKGSPTASPPRLSERKNFTNVLEPIARKTPKKVFLEPHVMDKENIDQTSVRKSGRTKKAPKRFIEGSTDVSLPESKSRDTIPKDQSMRKQLEEIGKSTLNSGEKCDAHIYPIPNTQSKRKTRKQESKDAEKLNTSSVANEASAILVPSSNCQMKGQKANKTQAKQLKLDEQSIAKKKSQSNSQVSDLENNVPELRSESSPNNDHNSDQTVVRKSGRNRKLNNPPSSDVPSTEKTVANSETMTTQSSLNSQNVKKRCRKRKGDVPQTLDVSSAVENVKDSTSLNSESSPRVQNVRKRGRKRKIENSVTSDSSSAKRVVKDHEALNSVPSPNVQNLAEVSGIKRKGDNHQTLDISSAKPIVTKREALKAKLLSLKSGECTLPNSQNEDQEVSRKRTRRQKPLKSGKALSSDMVNHSNSSESKITSSAGSQVQDPKPAKRPARTLKSSVKSKQISTSAKKIKENVSKKSKVADLDKSSESSSKNISVLTEKDVNVLARSQSNSTLSSAEKKPLPVWATERGKPRSGERQSMRRKSNIFDFSSSPVKAEKKPRKKACKPRQRGRVVKARSKLKTSVLITDPNFKNPLLGSAKKLNAGSQSSRSAASSIAGSQSSRSTASHLAPGGESVRSVEATERIFDAEFYARMNCPSPSPSGHESDEDVYDRDDGNIFEMFEGGTTSSFVPPQTVISTAEPMVSCAENVTPMVSKRINKYLGSSTPMADKVESRADPKQPATVTEDIAQCFGFDATEDDTDEDDHSLNLSPVRQSGTQSQLDLTVSSDIVDNISRSTIQSTTQPFRFSWGSLRPGTHSVSASRSSSMWAHGRSNNKSVSSLSSVSSAASPRYANSSVRNATHMQSSKVKSTKGQIDRTQTQTKIQAKSIKSTKQAKSKPTKEPESSTKNSVAADMDASVLFDEELLEEEESGSHAERVGPESQKTSSSDIRQFLAAPAHTSPQKSFKMAARKSYDKEALREARKRFEREYGGAATTEAETEEDVPPPKETAKRKKTVNRKKVPKKPKVSKNEKTAGSSRAAKKSKASKNDETSNSSQTEDEPVSQALSKKSKPLKKKENRWDKSVVNWADSLNSHFSEIEDSVLVVA